MTQQTAPAPPAADEGANDSRRGARWVNFPPSPEQFAQWFKENVVLDRALIEMFGGRAHEKYVGGVVLIPASDDKVKYVSGVDGSGRVIISTRPELYYIPYAQVQARIDYFWDLVGAHADEGWRAEIVPVVTPRPSVEGVPSDEQIVAGDQMIDRRTFRIPALADLTHQLPPGFFTMGVPKGQEFVNYLCCTLEVKIWRGDTLLRYGRGTKQVALVKTNYSGDRMWVDSDAIMKAETGALGRALGVAGIFVIPGSGVATAEDMVESQATQQAPAASAAEPSGPTAPAQAAVPAALPGGPADPQQAQAAVESKPPKDARARMRDRIRELLDRAHELGLDDAIGEWAETRFNDRDLSKIVDPPGMRGLIKKLETMIDRKEKADAEEAAAVAAAQEPEAQVQPEVPAPIAGQIDIHGGVASSNAAAEPDVPRAPSTDAPTTPPTDVPRTVPNAADPTPAAAPAEPGPPPIA